MKQISNPVLPGFYPDPSICRVEDDFYLVTSSFSFFPGLPVFHSRDLIHWEQIGHVIDRPDMIPLSSRLISKGLWAPTIRWHNGLFYVICTHSDGSGDFVCTAESPAGPWSDPHWIQGAPGIDPSLFWDEDGTCWMTGNDWISGPCHIWLCQFDDRLFRLIGEPKEVWRGALLDCHAPEAPHLYKKDGFYYLMIAEGGTGFHHAVTIARSEKILGPYTGYAGNPILTHRHLGHAADITCTGHADLVDLPDGSWYMACLGCRPYGGWHLNLGRETFLAPVSWEDGWPVVNPGIGRIEAAVSAPDLPEYPFAPHDPDNWHSPVWNRLGCQADSAVRIQDGDLLIRCVAAPIIPAGREETDGPLGFLGRRQQHACFSCRVQAVLPARNGASCGLIALQNHFHSLRVEIFRKSGSYRVRCMKAWYCADTDQNVEETLAESPLDCGKAVLSMQGELQRFTLSCNGKPLAAADGSFLGSETAGGFIGTYLGVFASGNGDNLPDTAVFSDFHYSHA